MSVTFEQTLGPGTGYGAGFVFVRTGGLLSCYAAAASSAAFCLVRASGSFPNYFS